MRILHLVNTRERRGAAMFASDLIASMNRADVRQRVVVLQSDRPSLPFDAPVTMLGSNGSKLSVAQVDPRHLDGLSDITLQLIDDRTQRSRLGTAARQRCCARYEISGMADRYLALYEELLT